MDFVLVMGGINDWAHSVEIGDRTSDESSDVIFVPAYRTMLKKIIQIMPECRIICITPNFCIRTGKADGTDGFESDGNFNIYNDGIRNNKGYTLEDYANATIDICKSLCIPCIDFYHLCGWNQDNYHLFAADGIHPSTEVGIIRFGNTIACGLAGIGI